MNPTGPRSSESKARNDLLALKKRKPKEPSIKILSIEETRAIEKEEEENKPKRKKLITTDRTMEDEHLVKKWEKGKKDVRGIQEFLPCAKRFHERGQKSKGPQITPMMMEFFQDYLLRNSSIKKIAVIGFNTGFTSEAFLLARDDIEIVAFDPIKLPYVSPQAQFLSEKYKKRFMLIGGIVKECISMLANYLGQKRFDLVYIDSGSYPRTAKEDLESSIYLAHSRTIIFMENVRPYSNTGKEVFEAWDMLVQEGKLRETAEPRTWEELNRCVCEGMFVAHEQIIPLKEGEKSKVRTFWETEPECVLWKYGNDLQKADPEEAVVLWEEMLAKGIEPDVTAANMFIAALNKSSDRKYIMKKESAMALLRDLKK